jgi:hypothetical protein
MPAAPHFTRIISADSHVMEPLHLWWHALGHKFGDRTPRSLSEYQGQQGNFFYTGYQGWPVSWIRDNRPETERAAVEAAEKGLEACGYDPEVRVRFQAEAGIEAEVMNPTRLLNIMRNPHIRSIGLDADATVAKLIAALPAHEQEMVVGGNAAEVFRIGR